MSIANIPFKASVYEKGERCIFKNRHSSGMAQFDGKVCEIIEVIPEKEWFFQTTPEYRIRFLEYGGKLNKFKVEENELEPLPN